MVRCPGCTRIRSAYLRSPKRTSCYHCGARWIRSAVDQAGIIGLQISTFRLAIDGADPSDE